MHVLTSTELLDAWEVGLDQTRELRSLPLLLLAFPELNSTDLLTLPIGRRDGLLLLLQERIFGSYLTALADCPACEACIELTFKTTDIQTPQISPTEEELSDGYVLEGNGWIVRFRLPNSRDLVEASTLPSEARQRLLKCVILSAECDGQSVDVTDLSEQIIQAVTKEMARLDCQADIQLSLICTACNHNWVEVFDIQQYFWDEVNRWALQLLADVHSLASTYSWSESEILSLSTRRRNLYLQMINP